MSLLKLRNELNNLQSYKKIIPGLVIPDNDKLVKGKIVLLLKNRIFVFFQKRHLVTVAGRIQAYFIIDRDEQHLFKIPARESKDAAGSGLSVG